MPVSWNQRIIGREELCRQVKRLERSRAFGGRLLPAMLGFVVCLGIASGGTALFSQPKNKNNEVRYEGVVPLGSEISYQGDDFCVTLRAVMSSADFFQSLRAKDTPSGREFRKANVNVTEFPKQIRILVQTSGGYCSPLLGGLRDPLVEGFENSLSFKVEWESGSDSKPADVLFITPLVTSDSEEVIWGELGGGAGIQVKSFAITVKTDGVPLSTALIVKVYSQNQKFVGSFRCAL